MTNFNIIKYSTLLLLILLTSMIKAQSLEHNTVVEKIDTIVCKDSTIICEVLFYKNTNKKWSAKTYYKSGKEYLYVWYFYYKNGNIKRISFWPYHYIKNGCGMSYRIAVIRYNEKQEPELTLKNKNKNFGFEFDNEFAEKLEQISNSK